MPKVEGKRGLRCDSYDSPNIERQGLKSQLTRVLNITKFICRAYSTQNQTLAKLFEWVFLNFNMIIHFLLFGSLSNTGRVLETCLESVTNLYSTVLNLDHRLGLAWNYLALYLTSLSQNDLLLLEFQDLDLNSIKGIEEDFRNSRSRPCLGKFGRRKKLFLVEIAPKRKHTAPTG
ncbi:hypothetical protein VNO77_15136 [Canavalia gladiata]|uniref:Uncharacterized protein n=1 Tax=Canavalia gladiata TaxID=3824 RepID=A0AAN9LYQ3_CANGL